MSKVHARRSSARFMLAALVTGAVWVTFMASGADAEGDKAAAPGKDAKKTDASKGKAAVSGSFSTDFDGVWADGASDLTLDQMLRLNVRPTDSGRLTLKGTLWTTEDLDGKEAPESALRGINDSYESEVRARLLNLYVEAKVGQNSTLRAGRQQILEGISHSRIDGLYFNQRYATWDWYAFVGARASLYENAHDDLSSGAGASVQLRPGTRLYLDAAYGEDHNDARQTVEGAWPRLLGLSFPREVSGQVSETTLSAGLMQSLWTNATLFTRYTWSDNGANEFLLDLNGYVEQCGLFYELRYRGQMDSVGERVSEFSGFYRVLGGYEQYDDLLMILTKSLGKKVSVSLEAEDHETRNSSAIGGNRDYQRLALSGSVKDLLPALDARVSVERWRVKSGEGTWALSGELTKTIDKLTITAGSDFQRYEDRIVRYDGTFDNLAQLSLLFSPLFPAQGPVAPLGPPWVVETHQNIQSFYAKVRWAICQNQEFTASLRYELDDAPESPYWRLRAGYTFRF